MGAWKLYLAYYRGSTLRLVGAVSLGIGQMIVLLPIPFLLRYAFDKAVPARDMRALIEVGLAAILLQALSTLLAITSRSFSLRIIKGVTVRVRQALIEQRYASPRNVYAAVEPGTVHDLLVHDTERLDQMTNALTSHVVPAGVLLLCVVPVLVWLSWPLALATASLLPPALFVSHLIRRRLRKSARAYHASFERFSRGAWRLIEAMDLTKIQAAERTELAHQLRTIDHLRADGQKMSWLHSTANAVHSLLATGIGGIILVVGGVLLARDMLSLGELMSFYVAMALLRTPLNNSLVMVPAMIEGREALGRVIAALRPEPGADRPDRGTRAIAFSGRVRFDAVTFGYDQPLLRNIDLDIEPGTVIGLSGRSGAGKTTLVMLMLGFYRPQSGRVLFDGHSLAELDLPSARRQIGVVPQDPLILPGTVFENIAYGGDVVTAAQVHEAAALADAQRFIEALPQGYETVVGSRGARLSGGQRQRIALARALVRAPRLLILDEPGNHLGTATVHRLLDSVACWSPPPAILLITHDPALLARLPLVLQLEEGRLAAEAVRT